MINSTIHTRSRYRRYRAEISTTQTWMLTFSDLTLLLLTMFVLLFAMSKPQPELLSPIASNFQFEKTPITVSPNVLPVEIQTLSPTQEQENQSRYGFIGLKTTFAKALNYPIESSNNSSIEYPGGVLLSQFDNYIELRLPLSDSNSLSIRETDALNIFLQHIKSSSKQVLLGIYAANASENSVNFQDTKQRKMLLKLIYLRQLLDAGISKESLVIVDRTPSEGSLTDNFVSVKAVY